MSLPNGFKDLATALQTADFTMVNIIGVVVDVMTPTRLKNGQYMLTTRLLDRELSDSIEGSQGMTVRFFRGDEDSLPKIRSIGDVLLLRNMKTMTYSGQKVAVSHYTTNTLLFPGASIPSQAFSIAYNDKKRIECHGVPKDVGTLTLPEQEYVIRIKNIMSNDVERTQLRMAKRNLPADDGNRSMPEPAHKKQKTTGSYGPKYKLIKDLQGRMYADLVGIVVKRIGTNHGCDMYITDYTVNEQMRYYTPPEEESSREKEGDVFGYSGPPKKSWEGPWGWLVLKINVKPPHAAFANGNVNEGDIVLLKNVKTRITREGTWLEGDMWPDDLDDRKIQISKVQNRQTPEMQEMLKRKLQYWAARHAQLSKQQQDQKQEKDISKAEKRRQKKEERRKRKAEADGITGSNLNDAVAAAGKSKINPHVRCSHDEVAVTKVRDILDPDNLQHINEAPGGISYALPFINAKYRTRVRVVDYEPKDLEDFAVQPEPELGSSPDSMSWEYNSPKYEWHFALLLEDAATNAADQSPESNRLWVHLQHEHAQFLLGNGVDNPEDLRDNPELLLRLKEKLFVLWGNLEEVGSGGDVSNRPFECCIEEYGIELDEWVHFRTDSASKGWQRMYGMFGTTIL